MVDPTKSFSSLSATPTPTITRQLFPNPEMSKGWHKLRNRNVVCDWQLALFTSWVAIVSNRWITMLSISDEHKEAIIRMVNLIIGDPPSITNLTDRPKVNAKLVKLIHFFQNSVHCGQWWRWSPFVSLTHLSCRLYRREKYSSAAMSVLRATDRELVASLLLRGVSNVIVRHRGRPRTRTVHRLSAHTLRHLQVLDLLASHCHVF